jgi:thioredoxin reductase (NADPH)
MSTRIKNYLGFPEGLSGEELTRRARDQALQFGAEILTPAEVTGVQVQDQYRVVSLADGSTVNGRALLIATGVSYRMLDVPGMETFTGAGIYYGAALTEALSCGGQEVYILGGANSAGQAAVHLANHAFHVTMLVRGASLAASMSQYLIDEINAISNIDVRCRTTVVEVSGKRDVDAITIEDIETGERRTVPTNVLFIFIGAVSHTDWVAGVVECDEDGYILAGPDVRRHGRVTTQWRLAREPFWLETSVPGIFVAGDVRHRSVKRVASAVGEGAMAVTFIHQYLAEAHQHTESIHHGGGLR